MKRRCFAPLAFLVAALAWSALLIAAEPPVKAKHMTGARPSPRNKLAAAPRFKAALVVLPADFVNLPPQNSVFLNDTYGICTVSEECVNLNTFAFTTGGTCAIIGDAELKAWAGGKNPLRMNFLNGATLIDPMEAMALTHSGGLALGSVMYCDGTPSVVDWTNRTQLLSAIHDSKGSVKISCEATPLLAVVGGKNGWYLGSYRGTNQDHCVGLVGYGSAKFLADTMHTALPTDVDPNQFCYALDTWGTVGIVAAEVIESPWVGEAWVRSPTSIAIAKPAPGPGPGPKPRPTPTRRLSDLLADLPLLVGRYQDGNEADRKQVLSLLDKLESETKATKQKLAIPTKP